MLRFLFALIFFVHSTAFAMPPVMHLDEVKPGMIGTAHTVVDSSGVIKSFNVSIVGVINNGKGTTPYIMARASGDIVNDTNGILQGMSGSPIYIDGKLIGALSAGFKDLSPFTFLITPIDNMLDIWNLPDNYNPNPYFKPDIEVTKTESDDTKNKSDEVKSESDETKSEADKTKSDETKTESNEPKTKSDEVKSDETKTKSDKTKSNKTKSDKTKSDKTKSDKTKSKTESDKTKNTETETDNKSVIIYNGFDSNGLNYLQSSLSSSGFKNFTVAPSNAETSIIYDYNLFGGSPVGAAVVMGDFTVGATGTITAVDNKKILGFGHSFTHGGNVNYFMTEASIIGAVPGPTGGMKMASVGSIIGRINQDRESGIAGVIGQFPSTVPISVTVNDDNYNALIAYNENLLAKLGAAIAYTALSKTSDSLAESTVKVKFDIKTDIVDSGTFSRENVYYNEADVGQLAVGELLQALTLVTTNHTAESNIFGIDVSMDFEHKRRTASLVSAASENKTVKPGEEIKLKVKLQPYRSNEIEIEIPYTVPVTVKEGKFSLDLHGGGLVPVAQVQPAGVIVPSTKSPKQLYEEKIQQLLNANKNNEIVIKPSAVTKTAKELKSDIKHAKKLIASGVKITPVKPVKFATNYIIDNVIQCTLHVSKN